MARTAAHGFTWMRDLRALGTDAARARARALVSDWMALPGSDPLPHRPDVTGARLAAWLGHYEFFADTADDAFRQRLMSRLVADARGLAANLPSEALDARAFTALKGLIAAAAAIPEHAAFLTRRCASCRRRSPARYCRTAARPNAARPSSSPRCRS